MRDAQDARTKRQGLLDHYHELRDQRHRLEHAGPEGDCPTCTRPLGPEYGKVVGLLDRQMEEVVSNGNYYKQRIDQLQHEPPELEELDRRRVALERELSEATAELGRLEAQFQEAGPLADERTRVLARIGELEGAIGPESEPFDEGRHREVQAAIRALEPLALHHRLLLDLLPLLHALPHGRRDHGEYSFSTSQWEKAAQYIEAHPEVRDCCSPAAIRSRSATTSSNGCWPPARDQAPRVHPHRHQDAGGDAAAHHAAADPHAEEFHPLWMSIHFTHPDELTPETVEACGRLADAGIPLGCQTVLLKGINDDVAVMKPLMHGLLKARVKPYYLYQCDPMSGSAHFRTPVEKGLEIIGGLRGHTTGYAVPQFVIDAPGGGGKIPLLPDYVVGRDGDDLLLSNFEGGTYRYPDPRRQYRRRRRTRSARNGFACNAKRFLPQVTAKIVLAATRPVEARPNRRQGPRRHRHPRHPAGQVSKPRRSSA